MAVLLAAGCGDGGGPASPTPVAPPPPPSPPPPPETPSPLPNAYFPMWNALPPEPWWRDSEPYSCLEEENPDSPWLAAALPDLGGSDPLSLIRFFGNGSYVRYGFMGFEGCTFIVKAPKATHWDTPVDPTYYSTGDLEILVDLARVPPDASDWNPDDGSRVDFSLARAVDLLNTHVAAYYRRISENQLRITFRAGEEFEAPGDGSPTAVKTYQFQLFGACLEDCEHGAPGAMNRILLNDVATSLGGNAYNGAAYFGLAAFAERLMGTIVHEIGHGWMAWPHSYTEIPWTPQRGGKLELPNPYSNRFDIMSRTGYQVWDAGMPSTLAINRYAAGWIRPEDVALHLEERATYTLAKPRRRGYQFLVVNSGRRGAFTTLEVLDDVLPAYRESGGFIYDPSTPSGFRSPRYEGVFVARYDQTNGTGVQVRVGPALYNRDNPDFLGAVGAGNDDYSLIPDGGERDIGGGVTVAVSRNRDGSYEVTVAGERTATFEPWCLPIRWLEGDLYDNAYDTGCFLDTAVWE